ncbi:RrF2 family transcriptional regulator [Nodularia spumigena]|uniref:RrF2 family transcriptional regulator n=1 Tax=Nodularia spumigena TaxID=70799 RepID=UPI002B1F7674|nr:Rrf2 family transcriptional regulator [Nodularia spumigena]MEA5556251.1 Rrf2 family transcriptional regulator [Nodularia spumigena CH309]
MLSQSSGYAATALGHIAATGGKPVLVKEIADAAEIPPAYLAKIIHALARKGLVLTQRGVGGGVTLARAASEITLFEICEALDDPAVESRCMLGVSACSDDRACPCHSFWTAQRNAYQDFLRRTSVADIAAFETRRRWKRMAETKADGKSGAGQ